MGSNLDKKITVADNAASIYDYMGQQCPNSMFINPVSEDEVVNIIKSCKPKHSKDCDDINMYVLSKVTDQIVKPLVHIFNISFSSGIFPSEMKMGVSLHYVIYIAEFVYRHTMLNKHHTHTHVHTYMHTYIYIHCVYTLYIHKYICLSKSIHDFCN